MMTICMTHCKCSVHLVIQVWLLSVIISTISLSLQDLLNPIDYPKKEYHNKILQMTVYQHYREIKSLAKPPPMNILTVS